MKFRKAMGSAASVTVASAFGAAAAFTVNILSARALGPELRGNLALILQLSYFIAPAMLLGAEKAVIRKGTSATHLEIPSVVQVAAIGVLVAPVCLIIAGPPGLIAPLVASVGTYFAVSRAWGIAHQQTRQYFVFFILHHSAVALQSLALFVLGVTDWRLWLLVYIFPGIVLAAMAVRPGVRFVAGVRERGKEFSRRGVYFTLANFGQLMVTRAERIIIPLLAGPRELGLYVIVATASEPMVWFSQAVADSRVSTSDSRGFSGRSLIRGLVANCMVAAVGGVALYFLLVPVFGNAYADARSLVAPLMVASVLLTVYRQLAGRVLLTEAPKFSGWAEWILGLLAVLVYIVSLSIYPTAVAAAWASVGVYSMAIAAFWGVCSRRKAFHHG